MKLCPICNKPVGDKHPKAVVYHAACAKRQVMANHDADELERMRIAKDQLLKECKK